MPEGSSSAAPVMRPGPRSEKKRRNRRVSGGGPEDLAWRGIGAISVARILPKTSPKTNGHALSATDADGVNDDKKDDTKQVQLDGPKVCTDEFVRKIGRASCRGRA